MSQTSINPAGQPTGRAGQLADSGVCDVLSGFNAEASAVMTFGCPIALDTVENSGRSYLNLATTSDKVRGVTVWGYNHQPGTTGDLDANGALKPKAMLDVLQKGRIYVTVEEAVAPGDRAFVRVDIGEASEVLGAWRMSADESDCIDITRNAVYLTGAAAGELAVVDVDFTIKS